MKWFLYLNRKSYVRQVCTREIFTKKLVKIMTCTVLSHVLFILAISNTTRVDYNIFYKYKHDYIAGIQNTYIAYGNTGSQVTCTNPNGCGRSHEGEAWSKQYGLVSEKAG